MLNNLKLIFVHGVNDQATNYSRGLYENVIAICRDKLERSGHKGVEIERIVQHEVLWANLTTDLTNRYEQLASSPIDYKGSFIVLTLVPLALLLLLMKFNFFRKRMTPWIKQKIVQNVDPLAIQIMHYIKDKGDEKTGNMNILKDFDQNMKRIFSKDNQDVGYDPLPGEGKNMIIVAHSLGSVIAFDYVMGFRKDCALDKHITLKSFVTMGAPIPIFTSAMGHPDSDLELPGNIKRWTNIINPLDGIARSLPLFFRKIALFERQVSFGDDPISAHTGYWDDKRTAEIIAQEVLLALKG